jgi:hypothetical protein
MTKDFSKVTRYHVTILFTDSDSGRNTFFYKLCTEDIRNVSRRWAAWKVDV